MGGEGRASLPRKKGTDEECTSRPRHRGQGSTEKSQLRPRTPSWWGGRGGGLRAPVGDRGKGTEPCSRAFSPQPAPDTALQPGGAGGGGGWTKWPPPPARQEMGQSAGAARQVTAQAGGDDLQGGSLRGEEDGPLREPGAVSRRTTSSLCAGRSAKPSQLESKEKREREPPGR